MPHPLLCKGNHDGAGPPLQFGRERFRAGVNLEGRFEISFER
jgi:hypothetical protein